MKDNWIRKIIVGIAVLLSMILVSTGLAWWLAGAIWSTFIWVVIAAIPTILVIKIIRRIARSA